MISFLVLASMGAVGSVYNWGMSVFTYNRDAWMTDIGLKQDRRYFTDELKIAEVEMHREDIRDLAQAQLSWLNNIILVETLILGLAGEVLVEGHLPEPTVTFVANAFMLCLASTMLYLVLAIALAIIAAQLASTLPTKLLTTRIRPAWARYRKTMKARRVQEATRSFEEQPAAKLFSPPMWPFWKMRLQEMRKRMAGKWPFARRSDSHGNLTYIPLTRSATSQAMGHDAHDYAPDATEPEMEIEDDRLGEEEMLQARWLREHWEPSERSWKPYREKSMVAFILGTKGLMETYGYLCVAQLYGPHSTAWAFWLVQLIFIFLNYCWGVFLETHVARFLIIGGPIMCIMAASTDSEIVDKICVPLCFLFHFMSTVVLHNSLHNHEARERLQGVAQRMTSYFPGWQARDRMWRWMCQRGDENQREEQPNAWADEAATLPSSQRLSMNGFNSEAASGAEQKCGAAMLDPQQPDVASSPLMGCLPTHRAGNAKLNRLCTTRGDKRVQAGNEVLERLGQAIVGGQPSPEENGGGYSPHEVNLERHRTWSAFTMMEDHEGRPRLSSSDVAAGSVESPMLKAGKRGNLEVVLLLYEHGEGREDMKTPSFWEKDSEGKTPMHIACAEGCLPLVKLWLSDPSCGCEGFARESMVLLDKTKATPLHYACSRGDPHILDLLLKLARSESLQALTMQDNNGQTPFHRACISGHAGIVKMLTDKAQSSKDPQICHELCNAARLRDKNGCTVFEAACESGSSQVVEVLLGPGSSQRLADAGLAASMEELHVRQVGSKSASNVVYGAGTVVCMMWIVAFAWAVDGVINGMEFKNSQAWWRTTHHKAESRWQAPRIEASEEKTIAMIWPSPHFKPRHLACTESHIFLADEFRVFKMMPDLRWPEDTISHNLTNVPCKISGTIGDVGSLCSDGRCTPTVLQRGLHPQVVSCDTGNTVPLLQDIGQVELLASEDADALLASHGRDVVEYEKTQRGWLPRWSVASSDTKLEALDSKQGHLLLMFSEGRLDVRDLNTGSSCGRWSLPPGVISGCTWAHKDVAMVLISNPGEAPRLAMLELPNFENCGFQNAGQLSEM